MEMQFCQPRFVLHRLPSSVDAFEKTFQDLPAFLYVPIQVFTPDGSIVDGEMVDHKNGTYEFVYIVPKEGEFSLALRLYDQHIKGSPFKLTVSRVSDIEVRPFSS